MVPGPATIGMASGTTPMLDRSLASSVSASELAVQWHPEYLAVNDDEASLALFVALVAAARRKAEVS